MIQGGEAGVAVNIPTAASSDVEQVMASQLNAFNDRDLGAFMTLWARHARLYLWPDRLVRSGAEEIRRYIGPLFAQPFHHALLLSRVNSENLVIDHLAVTQTRSERPVVFQTIAVYEVVDRLIARAWLKSLRNMDNEWAFAGAST